MEAMCVQQVETNQLLSLPRLLNNRMQQLRQQFLSRPKKSREPTVDLRQNLFGSCDKNHNLTFADEELRKMTQTDSRRWNFDIETGQPTEGQYHWQLMEETKQALDTSGRLTCLTTAFAGAASNTSSSSNGLSSSGFATSSKKPLASSSPSSSPNSKRAVTTTIFSTTTTPTAVISKKCVKRLQKSAPINKVAKLLITDYFKEVKPVAVKCKGKDVIAEEKDSVSSRLVEILKIRSMNVR